MYKIFLGIIFCFTTSVLCACDICGGASNAFSVGFLPDSKHHFLGVRTSNRWFESRPSADGHGYRATSNQLFNSTEFFGRYKIGKKIQIMGFVPYVFNQKKDSVITTIKGMGDVFLIGNYVFADSYISESKMIKQSGTIGFGLKAPTGKNFILGFEEVNMLPGTGSWDFISTLNYAVQFRKFGLQNESGFTYKTANKYLYKFGNALSISQLVFYRTEVNDNFQIIPQVGVNYLYNWRDQKEGKLSDDTFNGGKILNAQANLLLMYQSWNINCQLFIPIVQNLNRGFVTQKMMMRIGINYFISSKK